jgi:hypothetical protein
MKCGFRQPAQERSAGISIASCSANAANGATTTRGEIKMNTFGAAVWEGGIRDGKGAISTKSGALDK